MIAPYIANGYEQESVTSYSKNSINISPIKQGTFVNSTHVVATFVCGGCINSDSFSASNTGGISSVSMAYSSAGVSTPSDPHTQLSDHTGNGEPYGAIDFNFGQAKSAQYSSFAALAGSSGSSSSQASPTQSGNASSTSSGNSALDTDTGSPANATASDSSSASSPTGAGSQASTTPAAQTAGSSNNLDDQTTIPSPPPVSAGMIVLLLGLGIVYMVQPFI